LKTFAENEHGNLRPVAMHELIMPEASGRMMQNQNREYIKRFYYKKRGVFSSSSPSYCK
jgi:hypothetical protein